MNNQNAIHLVVTVTVEGVLKAHGIPQHELKDAVADITVRIIEATEAGSAPRTGQGWQRLAHKTAARYAVEERGCKPVAVTLRNAMVEEVAREHGDDEAMAFESVLFTLLDNPANPDRTRAQIALLLSMLDQGELPALSREILTGLGDGKPPAAVASSLGITTEDLRERLRTMRTRFFRRLAEVEALTAGVLEGAEEPVEGELASEDAER
jgi:hypothetical protein